MISQLPARHEEASMPVVPAPQANSVLEMLYPEYAVGGFTRDDQRAVFYSRINAMLEPGMQVLDFGAGRGLSILGAGAWPAKLADLRGKCRKVTGVDVGPAVLSNPFLDEARQIVPGERLPFADGTFDMIVSFAVLEHLEDPAAVTAELDRVLKPGGWLFAWTPNRWGYVAMAARMVPERLQAGVLRMVDQRGDADVFPKYYRINTLAAVARHFPRSRYRHHSFMYNGPPSYFGRSRLLASVLRLYDRLTPSHLARVMHMILHKHPEPLRSA